MADQNIDPEIDMIIAYLYGEVPASKKAAFEAKLRTDSLFKQIVQGQRNFRELNDIRSSKEHRERFSAFIGRIAVAGEKARLTRRRMREN